MKQVSLLVHRLVTNSNRKFEFKQAEVQILEMTEANTTFNERKVIMKINIYAFGLIASLFLAGCNGNSESSGNIYLNDYSTHTSGSSDDTGNDNFCDRVEQADFILFDDNCSTGKLSGDINQDYTLIEEVEYVLSGVVRVGAGNTDISQLSEMQEIISNGVTLTIEPGTEIKSQATGVLLVTRGSKLMAEGTATKPITFSSLDKNYDGMGEWGGVIIQGFAPQFGQGGSGICALNGQEWCNVVGEGGDFVKQFGGNVPDDNSGVIKYVRIAEGGLVAGPNNEINGLTLQGVGHGTKIEYVQVHNNLDDGIEWFGGTVNLKYAVLTNNDDDDIDYDQGYMGNIQYALIIKNQKDLGKPVGSNDPRGIELNSSDEDYTPETAGTIANVTIIGGDAVNYNAVYDDNDVLVSRDWDGKEFGMRLRGSVTVSIHNSAVTGYDVTCARIDYSDHDNNDSTAKLPTLVSMNNFLCDTAAGDAFNKEDPIDTETVILEPITFDSNYGITNASAIVEATSIDAYDNGSNFVFDQTSFIGAVDPSAATTWYEEWIIPGSVN